MNPSSSKNAAIIVAAGSSSRFGQDKLMALVQGRPLISYSLQAFSEILSIEEIVLVVAAGREEAFLQLVQQSNFSYWREKMKIVTGGKNRHESVQRGLRALSSKVEWVAIHDGARPLISRSMIESCFEKAYEYGAAALASPITETLHRVSLDHMAEETVDRTHLWAMQTPQIFRKVDLMSIKTPQDQQSPTDEVSALLQHGSKVYLVENREPNIKMTYSSDLDLVNSYLSTARKQ